ncbi:MAG TPA: 5-oxoprolinase subunit PxpB [Bryobacteraceae bacterium]|jgi:KipI family sensor histidine kinase inhibitor|nr:5-oxoprolinase subunit PxpB [Bryobacteraceae bacterium]
MTRFCYASDQSLLVYLGEEVNLETHRRVLKLLRLLEAEPIPGVRNLHPAYHSILIVFDPVRQEHENIERTVAACIRRLDSIALPEPRLVEIPVIYDGPDLNDVASIHQTTPERVIELHSSAEYVVYFVGFVPGFAYLGGLPQELATPRLESPRQRVPKGSVAIGGSHTGVYPFETPGGWRLIGRTTLEIFDPEREELSRLVIGDRVRFVPVA